MDEEGTKYDYSCTMQKVAFNNGKVVSASGEMPLLKNEIIADYRENNTENIKKTDAKTNIKLEATSSEISANTELEVTEITTGETFEKIKDILENVNNFKVYDITLKENNEKIQPKGKVKISIPIPEGFNASSLAIYRLEENGSKTEYKVTVANNYAMFETEHFSTYILGEKSKQSTEQATTENNTANNTNEDTESNIVVNDTKLPKTGEEINNFAKWLSIAIVLGIIWIMSMLLIEREKRKI